MGVHYKAIGVYCIINTVTGAVYVGSSVRSVQYRIHSHMRDLRAGRHQNPHLQAAWNCYGADAFTWSLLEVVQDPDQVLAREQHWLDRYWGGRQGVECYNAYPTAGSPRGYKQSEETIQKRADTHRGKKQSPETIARRVASLTGLKRSEEARRRISEAHKGIRLAPEVYVQQAEARRGHPPYPAAIQAVAKTYHGFVAPDGTEYRNVYNLHRFCKEHGLDSSCMVKVDKGKLHRHRGWRKLQ